MRDHFFEAMQLTKGDDAGTNLHNYRALRNMKENQPPAVGLPGRAKRISHLPWWECTLGSGGASPYRERTFTFPRGVCARIA